MLDVILKSITDIAGDTVKHYNHLSIQINKLMQVMESYPQSAQELMDRLGLKSREGFRKNYLNPALQAGLVCLTIPDKPTSKSQMYYKKINFAARSPLCTTNFIDFNAIDR